MAPENFPRGSALSQIYVEHLLRVHFNHSPLYFWPECIAVEKEQLL